MNQVAFDQLSYNLPVFSDHPSYIEDCFELTVSKLRGYDRIPDLEKDLFNVNVYENINYYPNPYIAWEMVKEKGLNMHIAVKEGFVYFQPVIGDINFLVKTTIFTRKNATPINAWKSADTTPLAINFMHMQDIQKGSKDYAQLFSGLT